MHKCRTGTRTVPPSGDTVWIGANGSQPQKHPKAITTLTDTSIVAQMHEETYTPLRQRIKVGRNSWRCENKMKARIG